MRSRRRWLIAVPAMLAVLVLLAQASGHQFVRTASAGTPDQFTLGVLRPGKRVCEGPLVSDLPARNVAIFGGGAGETAQVTVDVQDAADHTSLASGHLRAASAQRGWLIPVNPAIPRGRPVRVCVTDDHGAFSLSGNPGSTPTVTATGLAAGQRFSLVLYTDRDQSLLGSLSTAFSRASLWRPSWVGAWTFWVLAIALLATFGLGVVAVVNAADDDDPPSTPPREPEPVVPPPDDRSETSQDRPQPVS